MNDDPLPGWFWPCMLLLALVQTGLLLVACMLINGWTSRLNRKLHRIESAVSPEPPGPARHTGVGGNFMCVSRRKHSTP